MLEKKSCFECSFYDGICCMYKCAVKAIRNEEESAKNCPHYKKGEYNADKLEKNDYQ